MKTFLFSLLAQLVLLGAIVGNCFWVNHLTAHMEKELAALPECEQAGDALAQIEAYWQKRETVLGFSIPAGELERISNQLSTLRVSAQVGDPTEFAITRTLCAKEIARIRRLERFSLIYVL